MPQYNYNAKTREGQTIKGRELAKDREELLTKLARRNLIVISIQEDAEKAKSGKEAKGAFLVGRRKVKLFDLAMFFKQLASMLKGGLPLIRALDSLASETKNKVLKRCIEEISSHIRDGHSFSDGIKLFPSVFSDLAVAITESGETSGALDNMLVRLSEYLAATDRFNRKLRSSMAYPVFLLVFFVSAVTAVTLFLVPNFKMVYDGLNMELPVLTTTIFRVSDFFVNNLLMITMTVILACIIGWYLFFRLPKGRFMRDRALLRIPFFGKVILEATMGKFCKTLSTLLTQGISVPESFELASRTSNNIPIEDAGLQARSLILQGATIPEALKKAKLFPPLMIQMATVGVESGNLPDMLDSAGNFYEEQVDTFTGVMLTLVEPILIVGLGLTFAIVVVALYLPLFKMVTFVSKSA